MRVRNVLSKVMLSYLLLTSQVWADTIDVNKLMPLLGDMNSEPFNPSAMTYTTYNKTFGTSVNNITDLQADMTNRITFYANKLTACTPGNYRYTFVLSDIIYVTSHIKGKQNNRCLVDTFSSLGEAIGDVSVSCQMPPKDLIQIAMIYPAFTVINSKNPPNLEDFKGTFEKNCKVTTSGLMNDLQNQFNNLLAMPQ
jgi:hypothetical protein